MSDQPMVSIADAISAIPSPFPPISLIKHYKGTTLNQPGRIVDISPVSATIQASQRVTFHVLLGLIHLRTSAFPGAISATIRPIDYGEGTFYLSDLSYAGWRDRRTDRVQPKCPIYIDIRYYRKVYRACMEDISYEGMGILVNRDIDPGNRLRPGVKLSLEFRLASEHLITNLRGMIVYRKNEGQYLIKYGLQILPKTEQKKFIQSYIFQRSDEIRKELEQDYIRICDPCRVEDQYF